TKYGEGSLMSLGVYPVFEPKLKGTKFNALGELLAHNLDALDRIAWANRLTPFTAFSDRREVPIDFDGGPEDLDDLLGPCNDWYESTDGKLALLALVDRIRLNPENQEFLESPNIVIEELGELVRVLTVAAEEGVKFRLELG